MKEDAKTIVCYGDSNTWGQVPKGDRYPRSVRWVATLGRTLGEGYEVIEEGLPGRTFVASDPEKPYKTGITHLRSILGTHEPIDMVIVMLGTNDVKDEYNLTPENIAEHLEQTLQLIQSEGIRDIVVVCPPYVIAEESTGAVHERFSHAPEKCERLPEMFRVVAEKYGCIYVNAEDHFTASPIDGYHFSPEGHQKLAEVLHTTVVETYQK